ncbi:MAG: linear amide C-N hydrolase [Anaerolineae bacterium]|nr:linear amide C-N hydrolase [Anaerolineae bacterium]
MLNSKAVKWIGGTLLLMLLLVAFLGLREPLATLRSLEQVDDYPLYTLHYYGAYERPSPLAGIAALFQQAAAPQHQESALPAWGCSLFAALGGSESSLYGCNFDWDYSPAVLLFTDPPDGYASVSMVDITFLGFSPDQAKDLTERSLLDCAPLLEAPFLPFDGMNEYGLAIGMAAVPGSATPHDPAKETVGSLGIIREMLDHARTVDEAVALLKEHNIDMSGGPTVHYLIADAAGDAVLVEFYKGEVVVIPNEAPWHVTTNFLRTATAGDPRDLCSRYARIDRRLEEAQGQVTPEEAMELLSEVSQDSTQWSVVYGMQTGEIHVSMGQAYDAIHTLTLPTWP